MPINPPQECPSFYRRRVNLEQILSECRYWQSLNFGVAGHFDWARDSTDHFHVDVEILRKSVIGQQPVILVAVDLFTPRLLPE